MRTAVLPPLAAAACRWAGAVALAVAVLGAAACSPPDERGTALPELPGDVVAADFPGVSYPIATGPPAMPRPAPGPVWLVGVDGATWDLMLPLMAAGRLPSFAALMRGGAHGILLSEEPTLSPALWTTIATGVPRYEHGIVDFVVKVRGHERAVLPGPANRRAPALWNLVGAAGGSSTVVGWYASFPAEPIAGLYLSKDLDPSDPKPGQVEPPELAPELSARAQVALPDSLVARIGRSKFFLDVLLDDAKVMASLEAATSLRTSDLVAVYLSGIDVVQHLTWHHMEPSTQQVPFDLAADPAMAEVIPDYYELVDGFVGQIVAMAPADATIVVVSDHGGGPMRDDEAIHFQVEVLLKMLDLTGPGRPIITIGQLYRHDKDLWLNLAGVEENGWIPPTRAGAEAAGVVDRLRALRCADGSPLFAAVVDRTAEPAWRPGDPALTVRFSPHALVTPTVRDGVRSLDFQPVRFRHSDVSGAHRPEGVIIVKGPAVRPGRLSSPAILYHVAPTVLYLLGLPQDGNMLRSAPAGGGVLTAAIDPAVLAARPVTMVPAYPAGEPAAARPATDLAVPAEAETMERLRALGYLR